MARIPISLGALAFLVTTAVAQVESTPSVAPHGLPSRVPIHGLPADPTFGDLGLWAAGANYKVGFDDGATFHPVLGADAPRSLPVGWRTTSFGGVGVDPARASRSHTPWRYELRHPGFVERYDVRADGVEQSFVIARPLRSGGSLDIVGSCSSALEPALVPVPGTMRSEIRFSDDDGTEVVRYGGAIAFDAAGRRTDVQTLLDGERIRLRVPESWLASASYPVVVDPILSAQPLGSTGSQSTVIESSDVGVHLAGQTTERVMTTYTVAVSATDRDVHAVISDPDFGNPVLVFSDASTIDSTNARVAFVKQAGVAGRWTIALQRASGPFSQIRVWLHDAGNTVFGSGSMMFLPVTVTGWRDRRPDIGGSNVGPNALLAYETDESIGGTFSDTSRVYYVRVDADAFLFGTVEQADDGVPFRDRERPAVSQNADGAPLGWMLCYQRRTIIPTSDWEIWGRRIQATSGATLESRLVGPLAGQPVHRLRPSVDGGNTRFAVTYLMNNSFSASTGSALGATRFTWAPTSDVPTPQWDSTIGVAQPLLLESLQDQRVIYDANAGHWAVAYERTDLLADRISAARVGWNGAVVETQTATAPSEAAAAPGLAYDLSESRFLISYGTPGVGSPVFGRLWTYPSDATNTPYGTSCGGSFGNVSTPLVGTEFFRVRMTGGVPGAAATLLVGFQSTAIDLSPIGATGCDLLVGPNPVVSLPTTVDASGNALVTLIHLNVTIDLFLQWAHVSPSGNPLGVATTEGVSSRVR